MPSLWQILAKHPKTCLNKSSTLQQTGQNDRHFLTSKSTKTNKSHGGVTASSRGEQFKYSRISKSDRSQDSENSVKIMRQKYLKRSRESTKVKKRCECNQISLFLDL